MALRFDIGTLRPARRMADGRLRADAHITRAGVFEYLDDAGKIRRELRDVSEVFKVDSLASFGQVPVTNDHPSVGLLSSENARDFMVGSTGDSVTRDDDHVRASVMVADAATIKQMEAGKVEVSCGYTCDTEETPGTHPVFGKYDAIQRNIRGNHVAIVASGRAGKSARVRMDAMYQVPTKVVEPPRHGGNMDPEKLQETIRALGAQLTESKERTDAAEAKAKTEVTRADVAEGKLLTLESRVVELQTQIAAGALAVESDIVKREKERADSLASQVARFDSKLNDMVRERTKVTIQAKVVMGNSFRTDDLSIREMMATVVKRLDASADVSASVPDGVIEGRYLALTSGHAANALAQAHVAEVLAENREAAPRVDAIAQKKQAVRDQWKAPLPNDIRARKDA